MVKKLYVLLITLFFSNLAFASKPAFEYIGLDIDTTAEALHKHYPNSNDQTSAETKSYYIWVSKLDAKGGVYAINLYQHQEYWPQHVAGVQPKLTEFKWLTLSFETPDSLLDVKPKTWEDTHYFRHPPCESILIVLTNKYGSPFVEQKSWEEQIEHQSYKWESGSETMRLRCYKLNGKGMSLAGDIVLSKPVNESNK